MSTIIVDCKNIALHSGGISGFFKPLLKALVEQRKGDFFILTAPHGFDTSYLADMSNWKVELIEYKKTFSRNLDLLLYDFWILPKALKKLKADYFISPYYDFLLPLRYADKSIIMIHDLCYWDTKNIYDFKIKLYHKVLLLYNSRLAKKIITVSKTSKARLIDFLGTGSGDKIEVVFNTFEYDVDFRHEAVDEKMLLYSGGFEKRKNIERLFAALVILKKEKDIKLFFTGNNRENRLLKDLIIRYGLKDNIILTGVIDRSEMQRLYETCKAVVSVSLCEGFGRSNLEAAIYHKPLLCSDIAVYRELVGDYPVYCDPCDVGSIADGLRKVMNMDSARREDFDFISYSRKRNVDKFLSLVSEVVGDL